MTRRAVIALGIGQCLNWGVLYYAFGVLVLPLERELGVPTWAVTGAFSVALLTSAALAPTVGRWADHDRGAMVMQAGGLAAATLLVAWTVVPSVFTLYVAWAGLGLCMASTLYEPAFVIIGRAYHDPQGRLRALAAVTLFCGLASTVFFPATTALVASVGWRDAVRVLAVVLVLSVGIIHRFAFRAVQVPPANAAADRPSTSVQEHPHRPVAFGLVATMFALASLASAAFAANLVPALGERNISPATAAMLGGLIGVMQLPGRALLMNGALAASPSKLLAGSLALQAAGLGGVALASSTVVLAGATMVFALGAGLTTLVRPQLVQAIFRTAGAGHLNGRIARHQQLARAAGPLAVAWFASLVGYATVFAVIAGTFAVIALASAGVLDGHGVFDMPKERI